jgi:signal transduction histidine kinase
VAAGVLAGVASLTPLSAATDNNVPFEFSMVAATFLYAYAVGAGRSWRIGLVGLVPLTVGVALFGGPTNPLAEMITVGPWLAGLAVASRQRASRLLEVRARELAEERDVFAEQSVRYERARIARELHDIVAHAVSLMVVQASAGEYLAGPDPQRAAAAFDSIGEAARQASADIDRLVDLLGTEAPTAGPASLRLLEDLIDRARASGLRVSLELGRDLDETSDLVAETACRLVQEAMTNAMKYAPGAAIAVSVRSGAGTIEVSVINGPVAAVGSSGLETVGGGRGLAGLRERVASCGGTMTSAPTTEGGWCVRAVLRRWPAAMSA